MTTLRTLTILSLLTLATAAMALDHEGGIRFLVAEPTGDFGDAVDDLGFGAALHYGVRPHQAFTIGVGLQAMMHGRDQAGRQLASGVYHLRLESAGGVVTKALTLLK